MTLSSYIGTYCLDDEIHPMYPLLSYGWSRKNEMDFDKVKAKVEKND